MSRFIVLGIVIIGIIVGFWYVKSYRVGVENKVMQTVQQIEQGTSTPNATSQSETPQENGERIKVIAENLDTPWAIAFLPNGNMLITERPGYVKEIDKSGKVIVQTDIVSVNEVGEGGLLGIALHPKYSENNYVYFYYTYGANGDDTINRVVRMTYKDGKLQNEKGIVEQIPGASNHNGGRIKFGPDGYLYIGTGDAQEPSHAQDTNSLAGKILRVTDDGSAASGNQFNNGVYSYGHRNVQGLAWDKDGNLWATEHGPSGLSSCCDEVNKIEMGKNYGWPDIQDTKTKAGMLTPIKSSGRSTWAPSGMAYLSENLYFAGLRGQTLYRATLSGSSIIGFKEYLKGEYGRMREVVVGPDNMLYVTTSNQDGRGSPKSGDDKILRVNPSKL